ncbi:hypothetical protein ACTXT7_002699 [Hymenolepis weldensis]
MRVGLEFAGGAELLFGGKKDQEVDLPNTVKTIKDLLLWLRENMLTERPELFMANETIRPGILVLVNDSDWSLHGAEEYEIRREDKISFISTLHGG